MAVNPRVLWGNKVFVVELATGEFMHVKVYPISHWG